MKKIGFLHTSPVHIKTFDALFEAHQENYELTHLVDEPLLKEAMKNGITAEVESQVRGYVERLAAAGCDQVVCSCSTIGGVAEAILLESAAVLRIDRPMAASAVRNSRVVLMVAAIKSTLAPTKALLLDESKNQNRPVQIQELVLEDSWAEFLAGDMDKYYQAIAAGITDYLANNDESQAQPRPEVIVIAQASMAPAVNLLQHIDISILTSPELCVQYLLDE